MRRKWEKRDKTREREREREKTSLSKMPYLSHGYVDDLDFQINQFPSPSVRTFYMEAPFLSPVAFSRRHVSFGSAKRTATSQFTASGVTAAAASPLYGRCSMPIKRALRSSENRKEYGWERAPEKTRGRPENYESGQPEV